MTIAFSYLRFSSKVQERGDSLRRQRQLAEKYADQQGWTLDKRNFEDLGISAWKGKNFRDGALGAFLKAVDDGKIPSSCVLMVESLDRVTRTDVMDALEIFTSIINRGITLVTINDRQHYSRESIQQNWTQLIVSIATLARANEESTTKAKRIKAAWDTKRASGKPMTRMCPGWLRLSDDREHWEPVPEKVLVVQRIFELAASGLGTPTISDKLVAEDAPTMGTAEYWDPALVMAVLKNRSVIGTFTPKKADALPIDDYYPAIIDKDVFYAVQEHIAKRRKTGGRKGTNVANLFSAIARCECGETVRYVSSNRPHLYLQCCKSYSKAGCDAPTIPYNALEEKILFWIMNFEVFDLKITGNQVTIDPTWALKTELESKTKLLDKMLGAIETAEGQGVSLPTLIRNMGRLEQEIAALRQAIASFITPSDPRAVLNETHALYLRHQKLKPEGTQELFELRLQLQSALRRLITKVVLLKDTHKTDNGTEYRMVALYGPIVDLARQSEFGDIWDYTDDGGLKQDYALPAWGFGRKRRNRLQKTAVR